MEAIRRSLDNSKLPEWATGQPIYPRHVMEMAPGWGRGDITLDALDIKS